MGSRVEAEVQSWLKNMNRGMYEILSPRTDCQFLEGKGLLYLFLLPHSTRMGLGTQEAVIESSRMGWGLALGPGSHTGSAEWLDDGGRL